MSCCPHCARYLIRSMSTANRLILTMSGLDALNKYLLGADPDNLRTRTKPLRKLRTITQIWRRSLLDYRDKNRRDLVPSLDDLKNAPGVSDAVIASLEKNFYAGPFAIKGI